MIDIHLLVYAGTLAVFIVCAFALMIQPGLNTTRRGRDARFCAVLAGRD